MGLRGPAPKRPEDLVGHVSRAKRDGDEYTTVGFCGTVVHKAKAPSAVGDWSKSAKMLWKAAKESQQSAFYEPGDWEMLRIVLGDLTAYQKCDVRNSQHLAAIIQTLNELLISEGSRRRRRVLIDKRETPVTPPPADKEWHNDAKRMWQAAKNGAHAEFFEPSDWAYLHLTLTELTKHRVTNSSGLMFSTLMSMFADLLLTEGTRRQLDLDLGTAQQQNAGPTEGDKEVEKWLLTLTNPPSVQQVE